MGEDHKAMLIRYLLLQRDTLRWKLDGVSERDARMPMTPTGTNLLGLVKHVASVSAGYLGECVGRPFPERMPWTEEDAEPNADMWASPDETMAGVLAFWDRAWAHADATLEALPLEAPAHVAWWGDRGETTMGRLIVHLTAEIARHAGHADILRETIDGRTGLRDGVSNLPDGDAAWWATYVARLRATAEAAGE
ncbi:DinB family protein [Agrococcus sp. ARC_14]|uniref:DinB family protein n=1 Tax=Agrococcus sp. ARC_14 TaxID=2919927 RepID=UPI001F063916|nr:DinB family protein [Agrococcus sp. ARC_14]MCH1882507.1 DinB family protein [Agrococcus sp. ARC_14]